MLKQAESLGLSSLDELELASCQLELLLDDALYSRWQEETLQLAQMTASDPEVYIAYFRCCNNLIKMQQQDRLFETIDWTYALHHRSPLLAITFLEHLPTLSQRSAATPPGKWAELGLGLSRDSWKSIALGQLLLKKSSALLERVDFQTITRLVDVLAGISVNSVELAIDCLNRSVDVFQILPTNCHSGFLKLSSAITANNWADAWLFFERGPELICRLESQPTEFMRLVENALRDDKFEPFRLFEETFQALACISSDMHAELLVQASRISRINSRSALEFLKSAPFILSRIPADRIETWVDSGLHMVSNSMPEADNAEMLTAFFRVESANADQTLSELSGRVDFEHAGNLLRLYGQALAGEEIHVQPTITLINRGLGWTTEQHATTEGSVIYLPQYIDTFSDSHSNLQAYKVCVAHQTGRLIFGSFMYQFGKGGHFLPSSTLERDTIATGRLNENVLSVPIPVHRFFQLFNNRTLIHGLFSLVEDYRIDGLVAEEYRGLRKWNQRVKADELTVRPDTRKLGLRQVLVENLLRTSLNARESIQWPIELQSLMGTALGFLDVVARKGSTVQDSAEAAASIYDIASKIPNVPVSELSLRWSTVKTNPYSHDMVLPDVEAMVSAAGLTSLVELDYSNPLAPNFHGDFKPELVQALELLRSNNEVDHLSKEQLQHLLDQSEEVEGTSADTVLQEIESDEAVPGDADTSDQEWSEELGEEIENPEEVLQWYSYDEWDFKANDYLKGWCQLGERAVPADDADYYEKTLNKYLGLVFEVRRQFELMRPESQRILKNLDDGHKIELDKAIEFLIDKKAGVGPRARFYSRRDKIERSVAVAFLLDISGSTQEPVQTAGDLVNSSNSLAAKNGTRIIDIEKASAVLIIEALEAIGDTYGVFGFSGYGRNNVSYHIIKELDQPLDDTVKQRIGSIEPQRSTRMGAAIRHTTHKLADCPAKVKILILVSDGRPQDQGYGVKSDGYSYATHDTKHALAEAKEAGVVPFLITVDDAGHDYLKEICGDIGYEVVADIENLPKRLTTIYRYLATRG